MLKVVTRFNKSIMYTTLQFKNERSEFAGEAEA